MISKLILSYYKQIREDEHHRYRSWEHCYRFFRSLNRPVTAVERDLATLHLAFYLASWGMYRGASFLLQKDYKVHSYAVGVLLDPRFSLLWEVDITGSDNQERYIELLFELKQALIDSYTSNIRLGEAKYHGFNCREFTYNSIQGLLLFYKHYETDFDQLRLDTREHGLEYPPMKLVDMYF